jgi:hypothetical protein
MTRIVVSAAFRAKIRTRAIVSSRVGAQPLLDHEHGQSYCELKSRTKELLAQERDHSYRKLMSRIRAIVT